MSAKESWEAINIQKSDSVSSLLEERHILDEDIKQVIYYGETTGEKLYIPDENRYLAKLEFSNAIFYVDYSIADDSYIVNTAYGHRAKFVEVS